MLGFMELLPLCLHPLGAARESAVAHQISGAGDAAMAAAAQSDEFLPKKEGQKPVEYFVRSRSNFKLQ